MTRCAIQANADVAIGVQEDTLGQAAIVVDLQSPPPGQIAAGDEVEDHVVR